MELTIPVLRDRSKIGKLLSHIAKMGEEYRISVDFHASIPKSGSIFGLKWEKNLAAYRLYQIWNNHVLLFIPLFRLRD